MKFSALVEHVTKKPIPPHVTHFVVEVMASDEEGEDVEVRIHNCFCFSWNFSDSYSGTLHRGAQVIMR